jgi:uncharacterized membrane protein
MDSNISIADVIRPNFHLGWNLLLAYIPLVLSLVIFRRGARRNVLWWLGLVVFLAFLPNAPYVLTDVIHLKAKLQIFPPLPTWAVIVLLVEFGVYFIVGFGAYVASLTHLDLYLSRHGLGKWLIPTELSINLLCAIGIYLGRVQRLNSWNIVTQTERVFLQTTNDLLNRSSVSTILVFFTVITILYYPSQWLYWSLRRKLPS